MLKISNLIKTQLPSYISDSSEYDKFVDFIKSYYDWMYEEKGVLLEIENLPKYQTIEETLDEFIDYFYNEFMPSFPKDIIADKRKLLKYSKEFYNTKGTPASFKFLFRVLYNSSCEIVETEQFVLMPSSGEWFVPRSILIKITDSDVLKLNNYYVFGTTSKTIAKIEHIIFNGNTAEIFISDIKRNFTTNEPVQFVDYNLNRLYIDFSSGEPTTDSRNNISLDGTIISTISSAHINPKYRGLNYNIGNPVVFYGGGENGTNISTEALGYVGDISQGKISSVYINSQAKNHGYTLSTTGVYFDSETTKNSLVNVLEVDTSDTINLSYIIKDTLELYANTILYCNVANSGTTNSSYSYGFSSIANSNASTVMANAFSFTTLETHPIDSFYLVQSEKFLEPPGVQAICSYETDAPLDTESEDYDPRYTFGSSYAMAKLPDLGILGPIKVYTRGVGYCANDEIVISGIGFGAFAKITSTTSSGGISSIEYYQKEDVIAPLGGYGYSDNPFPTLTIQGREKIANVTEQSNVVEIISEDPLENILIGQSISGIGIPANTTVLDIISSANTIIISNVASQNVSSEYYTFTGTGAVIYVDGILGGQADVGYDIETIGSISTIKVTDYGENYYTTPEVSLRIQDFVVSNISISDFPVKGDILYQTGDLMNYQSYFDSATLIETNANPLLSKYIFRTYNYNKSVDITKPVYLSEEISLNIDDTHVFSKGYFGIETETIGVVTFGDGSALGYATFLSGLKIGNGQYISNKGFLSSYSVLQNEIYNNYTYIICVEKEIQKYRQIVLDLLHPTGSKLLGQCSTNTENDTHTEYEVFVSDTLTEFPPMLELVISTEDWETILFTETESRYGTWSSNSSIALSSFPGEIVSGYIIIGDGFDSIKINTVSFLSNTITCAHVYTSNTANNVEFIIRDNEFYGSTDDNTVFNQTTTSANVTNSSNTVIITTKLANPLANISIGDIISCEPTKISANITNNSIILSNVVAYGAIANGQYICARYIPEGTRVLSYYTGNSTIIMSNAATRTVNSTVTYYNASYDDFSGGYVTEKLYINLYDFPAGTTITDINTITNSISISNSSAMTANLFYIMSADSPLIVQSSISL